MIFNLREWKFQKILKKLDQILKKTDQMTPEFWKDLGKQIQKMEKHKNPEDEKKIERLREKAILILKNDECWNINSL